MKEAAPKSGATYGPGRTLALGLALALALVLGLAGCASRHEASAPPAAPRPVKSDIAASADFRPGAEIIDVRVHDRDPLQAAELIAPDGTTYPATHIGHDRPAAAGDGFKPSIVIAGGGGPRSGVDTGIGLSLPIFGWGGTKAATQESRASFAVPDMATYRATWKLWTIHLRVGKPGGPERNVTLPAPPP